MDKRGQPDTSIRDAVKSVSKEIAEKYVQEIVKETTKRVLGKQSEKLNEKELVKLEKQLKKLSDEEKLDQFGEAVDGASRDISQGGIKDERLLEKIDTRLAETFEKKIPDLLPKIILPPLTKMILIAIAIIAVLILGLVNDDGQYWPEATIDVIDSNPATEGEIIIFTGSGTTDDPNGYITAYRWESDRYGFLSSSQSFETTLPPGEHIIILQVRDNNGEWSEPDETYIEVLPVEPENQAPEAHIDYIYPNTTVYTGTPVIFEGYGSDPDENDYITAYEWQIENEIVSNSKTFTIETISAGTHTVQFRVRDDNGEWSEPDETYIEVLPVEPENQAPEAHIDYIYPNTTVYTGTPVTFAGYGTDTDENDYITAYEWRINTEIISKTKTFTIKTLPVGTHTVQFRVMDNNEAWSEPDEAYVEVLPLLLPDLHVSEFSLNPPTPVQYSQVSVRIGVYNQGTVRSGSFIVEWWAGENFTTPACTWKVNSLDAGEKRILTCAYKGYRSWYGRLTTRVVVDSLGTVAESDEENNVERKVISVSQMELY